MVKLKGKDKLNKKISKIVKDLVGFKVKCKISNIWQSLYYENKIWINPIKTEVDLIQDEYWMEWMVKRYNWVPDSIFMFSLLHEIGHLKTQEGMINFNSQEFVYSEDIESQCDDDSVDLCIRGLTKSEDFKKVNLDYFSCPLEAIASDWAEIFYRSNTDRVNRAFEKIQKTLNKWYRKNGLIEGDD